MSFTYANKEVFRKTSEDEYPGNPGNPASILWPYLEEIDSGYGGNVTFNYTQICDNTTFNAWTRQAVTTKTVKSGIGAIQAYEYTYDGCPHYKGVGWDQEFRGWNKVKETDAEGNYVEHWFYTTGDNGDGKNAEKLTGKEYKIEWFDTNENTIKAKSFDWAWEQTDEYFSGDYLSQFGGFGRPIAVSPDGYYLYVHDGIDTIARRATDGTFINSWEHAYLNGPRGIATSSDGYVYVASYNQYPFDDLVFKFTDNGTYVTSWGVWPDASDTDVSPDGEYIYVTVEGYSHDSIWKYYSDGTLATAWAGVYHPRGIAASPDGNYVYIGYEYFDGWYFYTRVGKFTNTGSLIEYWSGGGGSSFINVTGIDVSPNGDYVYIADSRRVFVFSDNGTFIDQWNLTGAYDIAASDEELYVNKDAGGGIYKYRNIVTNWRIQLDKVDELTFNSTSGNLTSRVHYTYDDFGNITTEEHFGNVDDPDDGFIVQRDFKHNEQDNILSKPAWERIFSATENTTGQLDPDGLLKESYYYYDGYNEYSGDGTGWDRSPDKGNLTRLEQSENSTSSISSYYNYYSNGNLYTSTDASGNATMYQYETTFNAYPSTTYFPDGTSENFSYDWHWSEDSDTGLVKVRATDANGNETISYYDEFNRLSRVMKPGDSYAYPSVEYRYNDWGQPGQQNIEKITNVSDNETLRRKDFFDGLGRIIQIQNYDDSENITDVSSTKVYDTRGLIAREYVPQSIPSENISGYESPIRWLEGCIQIAIDHTKIEEELYHFPALIHLTEQNAVDVFEEVGANFQKIAVTKADGTTQLYVEVEKWDTDVKEAWLWVSGSDWQISDSEDTILYLYYDSAQPDNTDHVGLPGSPPAQNVWDSNFMLVDHMQDAPDTTHTKDSTSHANNGTKIAANQPLEQTGKIGKGQTFDGINDTIDCGTDSSIVGAFSDVTVEAWLKTGQTSLKYIAAGRYPYCGSQGFLLSTNCVYLWTDGSPSEAGAGKVGTTDNNWHYTAATYAKLGGTGNIKYYVDDMTSGTGTAGGNIKASTRLYIGSRTNYDYFLDGQLDEMRISNIVRSPAWIKATYYSGNDELISFSTTEEGSPNWRYASYTYDPLGRVLIQTAADNTTITHDYSLAWTDNVTNERDFPIIYHYDAFNRLVQVDECSDSSTVNATTTYSYDVLGNLLQVEDAHGNTTNMTYNWLSRKLTMTDPDMGAWEYQYDDNGNLRYQTDAKDQTIEMDYDNMNRLTGKEYSSANMTNIVYNYDEGANGKGRRTSMTDASGSAEWRYDARGRLVEEERNLFGEQYVTKFGYDNADRLVWVLYPGGENVTQTYNGRGLPDTLGGTVAGDIVTGTSYNALGLPTQIDLGNGLSNSFAYWGIDETGGYYGRLYQISVGGLMNVRHAWDAGGNLVSRYDALVDETESFTYDFLDRLTAVSGNYTRSYGYNEIGNITRWNDLDYTYDSDQPHAVDYVGETAYDYDANGNMTGRDGQSIEWDAENRPVNIPGEEITLGNAAENRATSTMTNYTVIEVDNPAEADGTLDTVEVQAQTDLTGFRVGTFYLVSGATYKCRDSVYIGGVTAGSNQTFSGLSLEVKAGDCIGYYCTSGLLEADYGSSAYYETGEHIDPGDQASYNLFYRVLSLYASGAVSASFVYDGDGNRVKKIKGGETNLYINKYFEVNLSTSNATSYYYLGDRLVAMKENEELRYVHQDHLGGTALVTDEDGELVGTTKYYPYGNRLESQGDLATDRLFTGQRLDQTGLYYYGARYYDPTIGRFISADTFVPDPRNPQALNRYSYCLNNPLKYVDPTGHWTIAGGFSFHFNILVFHWNLDVPIVVFDDRGHEFYDLASNSFGVGSEVSKKPSVSITAFWETTNADSIYDLAPKEQRTGFAIIPGAGGGYETIDGYSPKSGELYTGSSIYLGFGSDFGPYTRITETEHGPFPWEKNNLPKDADKSSRNSPVSIPTSTPTITPYSGISYTSVQSVSPYTGIGYTPAPVISQYTGGYNPAWLLGMYKFQ